MKYFNYILIILGALVALYAKTVTEENLFILIAGIIMLMVGIYRISKAIPSKFNDDQDQENNETN